MNKSIKVIATLLLVVMIISMFSTVFAVATDPGSLKGDTVNDFKNVGNKIIGMVQAIGSIVSVLILVVLGIKYMMGSAEEKAEYKKTMIPYLVGAVLVFAGTSLVKVIYSLAVAVK